jgi:hypothetical protein
LGIFEDEEKDNKEEKTNKDVLGDQFKYLEEKLVQFIREIIVANKIYKRSS